MCYGAQKKAEKLLDFRARSHMIQNGYSGGYIPDEELVLPLTGWLTDGTPVEGSDCIRIVGKVPRPVAAKKADTNGDGIVNILDFGMIAEYWLEPAAVEY
jgi:hypothetical protein